MTEQVVPGVESFFEFVRLRQEAWFNKEVARKGPPYSDDPAIARFHFTNVYRELDRGTLWFRRQLGEQDVHDPEGVLSASLLYRQVNRIDTFERWGGLPVFRRAAGRYDDFIDWLETEKAAGRRAFTGRHLVCGTRKVRAACRAFAWDATIAGDVFAAPTLAGVTRRIQGLPGIGPFFAWQITCDLLEAGVVVPSDAARWAHLGPGALKGLSLVAGRKISRAESVNGLLDLVDHPLNWVPTLHVAGTGLPPRLTAANVEHALCEYFRWVRARNTNKSGLEVREWAK